MWLKLIIIGALLYGGYRLLGGRVKLPEFRKSSEAEAADAQDEETLVECVVCSTYVVKKEAIYFRGKPYCSRECLSKGS